MLTLHRISKAFGTRSVLSNVELHVAEGERVALVGPNGCGKSTLLHVVSGLIEPDDGELRVPESIGFAPEKPDMPDHLLAAEWIDIVASLKGTTWKADALGIAALAYRKVSALSLGQRQRVSLFAAMLGSPRLLVLDEPTNALDDEVREELIAALAHRTLLLATHDQDFARRVATRIVTMHV